jgi:hypothetical protein
MVTYPVRVGTPCGYYLTRRKNPTRRKQNEIKTDGGNDGGSILCSGAGR